MRQYLIPPSVGGNVVTKGPSLRAGAEAATASVLEREWAFRTLTAGPVQLLKKGSSQVTSIAVRLDYRVTYC